MPKLSLVSVIMMKLTASSFQVEGIQVHADEGGATQTRGGVYWLILPAGCLSLSLSLSLTPTFDVNDTS